MTQFPLRSLRPHCDNSTLKKIYNGTYNANYHWERCSSVSFLSPTGSTIFRSDSSNFVMAAVVTKNVYHSFLLEGVSYSHKVASIGRMWWTENLCHTSSIGPCNTSSRILSFLFWTALVILSLSSTDLLYTFTSLHFVAYSFQCEWVCLFPTRS